MITPSATLPHRRATALLVMTTLLLAGCLDAATHGDADAAGFPRPGAGPRTEGGGGDEAVETRDESAVASQGEGAGAAPGDTRTGEGRRLDGTFRYIHPLARQDLTLNPDGSCHVVFKDAYDREEAACTYSFEDGEIRLPDGVTSALAYHSEDLLMIEEAPFRRVLEDGTVVDYPQFIAARFLRSGGNELYVRADGTITHEWVAEYGGGAQRGVYDLHEGFVRWEDGHASTIFIIDDMHLRLNEHVYTYRG